MLIPPFVLLYPWLPVRRQPNLLSMAIIEILHNL